MNLYRKLNYAWKQTCKIVLGDEVGELRDYRPWLEEVFIQNKFPKYGSWKKEVKSSLTGEVNYIFAPFYEKGVKFGEYNLLKEKKIEPLSINEIKDIDSILEAWKDRWYYRTNVVLGNSYNVEKSDSVFNSSFVLGSYAVVESSYVAYSLWIRNGGKYAFGSFGGPGFKFSIRSSYGSNLTRGLETYFFVDASDVYFSHYVIGSTEIMFSFNQVGKHYVIGNLQLSKDKYMRIKSSLLEQIRDELKRNKRLPSLMEIVGESSLPPEPIPQKKLRKIKTEEGCSLQPIEEGFKKTTKILLGKSFSLGELKDYLTGDRFIQPRIVETPGKVKTTYYPIAYFSLWPQDIDSRVIVQEEVEAASQVHLKEDTISNFQRIKDELGKIAYILQSTIIESRNVCRVSVAYRSRDVAYFFDATENKMAAYNHVGSPSSTYIFGSFFTTNSSFIINSDANEKLRRAMEADRCSNSNDIYFSHDIDGSSEVMFSQHLKGARYTIGNLKLSKDKYLSIKKGLLEQIAKELETKGTLHFSVRSMGL